MIIIIKPYYNQKHYVLEAYLQLSEYVNDKNKNCKQLTFQSSNRFGKNSIIFNCVWNSFKELESKNYMLEITAVKDFLYMPRKLLFRIPEASLFGKNFVYLIFASLFLF